MKSIIFITGFSGSGKTAVGREVAQRLGWTFVDTDDEIVGAEGRPIEAIFREDSESRFRELERECLASVCRGDRQVVSTGGGMVTDERNRRLMEESGFVVCLEARSETILRRLSERADEPGGPVVRPMLEASEPLARIEALKSERQASYALARWTVHTDRLAVAEVAAEVVRAWTEHGRPLTSGPSGAGDDLAATVRTSSGEYPVWVGWGSLEGLGKRVKGIMSPGAAYVVSDEGAYRHACRAQASLEAGGIPSHLFLVPQGESSKSLATAQHLYRWLAGRRAERGHLLVAVGGGVVGDLAGYVAATFLRGIQFGQVPTTLLAMVDAAVGGKTAIDLPEGKNLVGAFHQPRFVLADVQALESLPPRELTSGWAEVLKHGLVLDEGLLRRLEENRDAAVSLERKVSTDVIRWCAAIKADVVSRDEVETKGLRVLLNYGHTIGHAMEAVTGYARFFHGEAVSVGMMAAANISSALGMLSAEEVERQRSVLEAFGLPVSAEEVDAEAVTRATAVDKKTEGGAIRWVLLDGIGHAVTRTDVPPDVVERAAAAVLG